MVILHWKQETLYDKNISMTLFCLYHIKLNIIYYIDFKQLRRFFRWMSRKLNVEFEEMLASTTGKFMNQIQVSPPSTWASCRNTVKELR